MDEHVKDWVAHRVAQELNPPISFDDLKAAARKLLKKWDSKIYDRPKRDSARFRRPDLVILDDVR